MPRFCQATRSALPGPSAAQLQWQRDELALFLHFGVNTFTDREWGDGREDPAIFVKFPVANGKGEDRRTVFYHGVGLIDATWPARFPPPLGDRLQELLDDPNG